MFNDDGPMSQLRDDVFIFYSQMLKEMERHFPEKGLSYRERTFSVPRTILTGSDGAMGTETVDVEVSVLEKLNERCEEAFDEWKKTREPSQLVDVADFCMMIWVHEMIVLKNKGEINK